MFVSGLNIPTVSHLTLVLLPYNSFFFFFTNYWKSTLQIPYIKYEVQWIVSSSGMLCRQIWRMVNKVSEVQNLGLPEHRASYLIFWTKLIIQTILSCFDTTVTIKRWQSDFILMEMKISVCINNLIKMILVRHWLEIIWLHFVLFIICTKEETGRRMHFTQLCVHFNYMYRNWVLVLPLQSQIFY